LRLSRENEVDTLAIFGRGVSVLLVPMSPEHLTQAHSLISNLMEWLSDLGARAGACTPAERKSSQVELPTKAEARGH
jgi:hypothetical protein